MAMPQRDEKIEAIKRLDALLEYAVMHNDEAEADRLRAELRCVWSRKCDANFARKVCFAGLGGNMLIAKIISGGQTGVDRWLVESRRHPRHSWQES